MLLITGTPNWADEITFQFFCLMPESHWEKIKKTVEKEFKENPITIYVGTNQEIEVDNYKEWLRNIKVREISPEESAVLANLFPSSGYWKCTVFGAGSQYITKFM